MSKRSRVGLARSFLFGLCLVAALRPTVLSASDREATETTTPFTNAGSNFLASVSGWNSLYWLSGAALTAAFSASGVDRRVHDAFAENDGHETFVAPVPWIGYGLPVLLGAGFFSAGFAADAEKPFAAGCAVLQASLLAVVSTSALKAVTGRPNPSPDEDNSRDFRFGFLRGGVHWGWPSGHMAANTAAVVSLLSVYDDNMGLKALGGLYLGWLFFGVISHEGGTMHWFSDAAAGSLVGFAIGTAVGDGFRLGSEGSKKKEGAFAMRPLVFPSYLGVAVLY